MDKETELWYENQFDMFYKQGWKDLVEQVKELRDSYNQVSTIKDEKELHKRLGQLDILDWLVNWEESVNASFKDLQNVTNL